MREDDSGNGRIEPSRDGAGHPTTDKDIGAQHTACGLPQKASHRRAKMNQRPILADGRAATCRDEGRQGRSEAGFHIKFVVAAMCSMNRICWTVPPFDSEHTPNQQNGGNSDEKADNGGEGNRQIAKYQQVKQPPFAKR